MGRSAVPVGTRTALDSDQWAAFALPAHLADHSREVGVLQKPDAEDLRPWERAPASGYYQLLNGFGRPTGERAFVQRGDFLPSAPRPLRWRLMHSAGDNRSRHAAEC